jgi:hypothetical protein
MTPQLGEDITLKNKFCVEVVQDYKVVQSSTMFSLKSFMVFFITSFLEAHVFIVPRIISLRAYHWEHSRAIIYHTRLPQLRKDGIIVISKQRTCRVSLWLPTV